MKHLRSLIQGKETSYVENVSGHSATGDGMIAVVSVGSDITSGYFFKWVHTCS